MTISISPLTISFSVKHYYQSASGLMIIKMRKREQEYILSASKLNGVRIGEKKGPCQL